MNADIVWHYTPMNRARQIIDSGFILGATAGMPPGERPCAWFSACPTFEPFAQKALVQNGQLVIMTIEQMHELFGGLARFGVARSRCMHWRHIQKVTGMKSGTARRLEREGRRQGAVPGLWWVIAGDVPLAHVEIIETGDRTGKGWSEICSNVLVSLDQVAARNRSAA